MEKIRHCTVFLMVLAGALAIPIGEESKDSFVMGIDEPTVYMLPFILERASEAIERRTFEVIQKVLSMPSLNSLESLPFPNFEGRTFEQFISYLDRNVQHDFETFPPEDEQRRTQQTKCRDDFAQFKKKLRTAAHFAYWTGVMEIRSLLHEESRRLERLSTLKVEAKTCHGEKCDEIALDSFYLKGIFFGYADKAEDIYASIANGTAIENMFREVYDADLLDSESNMIEKLRHCILGDRQGNFNEWIPTRHHSVKGERQ